VTSANDRFDRDPEALAWARAKVQHALDRLANFEKQAAAEGSHDQATGLNLAQLSLRRTLIGGQGCVIGAFDERLPEHRALLDRAVPLRGEA
jgi:hypothetical protein